ncbi:MAG: hypothetical protein JXN60_07490, partial [Lentisphaerae bacterium]|nr:hypothetical protein [Lentisphaerota bacterium]
MPKDVDAGKVAKGQLSEWYLRIDGGLTYGPIPLQTLSDWAAQGRVAAGNEVSNDKETWISAEKVPDLKMDWIVELKNGDQYGPFSLLAAPYLINRGVIDVDAMLHNLNTGKTLSAQALLKSKGQENVPGAQIAGTSSEESVKLETKAMHMSQSKSNEGGQVARPLAARETGNTPLRMGEADRESLVRSSSPQKMSKAPAAEDSQREGTALDHGAKDEELAQLIAGLSADLEKKNLKIAEQDKQILELKEDYQSLKDRSRRNERQLADKLEEINRIAGDEQAANEQLRKLLEDEKAKRSNVVTQKEHDISEQVVALKKALADAQNTAAAKEQDFLARISKVEKELEAAKKDLALKEQA